jgi:hypothetical protein
MTDDSYEQLCVCVCDTNFVNNEENKVNNSSVT